MAKIDYLTVDAAGGGTGMSPWRMMNEWGVRGVELWSLVYKYCNHLAEKGEYVPDIVALTKEAAEISGIRHVMEADREEAIKILG